MYICMYIHIYMHIYIYIARHRWGAQDSMPAPAFLALNNRVAIVCLAGEREAPRHTPAPGHHRGRSASAGTQSHLGRAGVASDYEHSDSQRSASAGTHAASPLRGQALPETLPPSLWAAEGEPALWAAAYTNQTLPPSLWASTHTSSPGSVQAVSGGGHGGRRRDRDAESRNACPGAGVWAEEGGHWGLLPNDVCECAVPRPAGGPGSESGGRAVRVLVERAELVFRAMVESKVWGLLKGRELLVVGHGLGGGAAHLLTVQALSALQHPLLCRTFYSLALGPCLPAGVRLSVADICIYVYIYIYICIYIYIYIYTHTHTRTHISVCV